MSERRVSRSRTIPAPAAAIFELLTDPTKHPVIDGSGTVKASRGNGQRLSLGSEFGMDMHQGMPYRISNKVVEYEEGRLIAWRHFGRHRWRWELEPLNDRSTKVTETFDYSSAPAGLLYGLLKFPQKNAVGIEKSLQRLGDHFAGESSAQ